MALGVNERSPAVAEMADEWPMLEALNAGTRKMREGGSTFLPKWPGEDAAAWTARKDTATLFPAFRRTVTVMAGKPFSSALTLSPEVPAQIVEWADDIDQQGVNLHTFAAETLAEALAFGFCGILVDAPPSNPEPGRVVTLKDQQDAGVRPYFVRVEHARILGWRTGVFGGVRRLTQLRLSEVATVADGDFGETTVNRVRVLSPGAWALYELRSIQGADQWVIIENGKTGLSEIPFVPVYGRRAGYMRGLPPLLDLAFLNVKHWQSQSDQDTIEHVARVPILAIMGIENDVALTVGASTFVKLPLGADMKFVEHSGAAIGVGQQSLEALEEQMIQAGAELLVKKPGDRSATEAANDAEANKSDLQRIVEGFEDSLDQALQFMAEFAGMPSGGNVSLFKDFGAANLTEASGQLVLAMHEQGLISRRTAIEELKRRGELAAEVTIEGEDEALVEEMPDEDAPEDIEDAA